MPIIYGWMPQTYDKRKELLDRIPIKFLLELVKLFRALTHHHHDWLRIEWNHHQRTYMAWAPGHT